MNGVVEGFELEIATRNDSHPLDVFHFAYTVDVKTLSEEEKKRLYRRYFVRSSNLKHDSSFSSIHSSGRNVPFNKYARSHKTKKESL